MPKRDFFYACTRSLTRACSNSAARNVFIALEDILPPSRRPRGVQNENVRCGIALQRELISRSAQIKPLALDVPAGSSMRKHNELLHSNTCLTYAYVEVYSDVTINRTQIDFHNYHDIKSRARTHAHATYAIGDVKIMYKFLNLDDTDVMYRLNHEITIVVWFFCCNDAVTKLLEKLQSDFHVTFRTTYYLEQFHFLHIIFNPLFYAINTSPIWPTHINMTLFLQID